MNWKQLIGDNWDIGKLQPYIKKWDSFVIDHQKLIYRAMLNYGTSREELSKVIPTYI